MVSLIKGAAVNLAVAQVKDVDLSEVVLRVVDLVKGVRVKIAIKRKKSIMDSLHLCQPTLKIQEMGLKEVRQKGENPSTRVLESLETLAKASDF
jgi:hypothetical protein